VRVGVAIRSGGTNLAVGRPAIVLNPADSDPSATICAAVRAIVEEIDAESVLVGLPLSLRGAIGPAVEKTLVLARLLSQEISLPVLLVDERLSSLQAQQALRAAGKNTRRSRADIDSASAIIVLQSYLDGAPAISLDDCERQFTRERHRSKGES